MSTNPFVKKRDDKKALKLKGFKRPKPKVGDQVKVWRGDHIAFSGKLMRDPAEGLIEVVDHERGVHIQAATIGHRVVSA